MTPSYYDIHRTPEGKRKRQAWFRARGRAMTTLSYTFAPEARRLVESAKAEGLPSRKARERAQRELARKHPRVFQRYLSTELGHEEDYQIELRTGPKRSTK